MRIEINKNPVTGNFSVTVVNTGGHETQVGLPCVARCLATVALHLGYSNEDIEEHMKAIIEGE